MGEGGWGASEVRATTMMDHGWFGFSQKSENLFSLRVTNVAKAWTRIGLIPQIFAEKEECGWLV